MTPGVTETSTLISFQRTYDRLNVEVEPLRIGEGNLNTKRMLDLMAVSHGDGPVPLYMHAVYRILREMRIDQQENNSSFSYADFKSRLAKTEMTPAQTSPLNQRLETLESFMPQTQIRATSDMKLKGKAQALKQCGTDWTSKVSSLKLSTFSHQFFNDFSPVVSLSLICRAHASRQKELALSSTYA